MPRTRIRRLHLANYRQFKDVVLDFTDPLTGAAQDRVCLIGRNGTGKSTVLELLRTVLSGGRLPEGTSLEVEQDGTVHVATKFIGRKLNTTELVAYCPAETPENVGVGLSGVPATNLDSALKLFNDFPQVHVISSQTISEMWRLLVYLIKRRENDRQAFETRPDSLEKTKAQLIREFDALSPPILERLAEVWNPLLEPAGLEFDVANASIPVQLRDNLEAYIRLRETHARIEYGELSTGIRNFIFRVGHLFLLYFNRRVESGFLLMDEPENSLFPDFLYDLVDRYAAIVGPSTPESGTQIFMATHSPIIASQFEPPERVLLEWGDDGFVRAGRGSAPKGDDPNDLLLKDFHLPEVLGAEGQRQWAEYLRLRRALRTAPPERRDELLTQAVDIATRYRFEPPP